MNLLPGRVTRRVSLSSSRTAVVAGAGAIALIVLLAIPTIARKHHASDLNHQAASTERENTQLQQDIAQLKTASNQQRQLADLQASVGSALSSDVSWARLLNEIARTIPNDVWLTSFQGQVVPAAASSTGTPSVGPPASGTPTTSGAASTSSTTPASGVTVPGSSPSTPATVQSPIDGTVTFDAVGLDFPAVADWLKRVSQILSFTNVWVPNASQSQVGTQPVVTFSSTADLTNTARSTRATQYGIGVAK